MLQTLITATVRTVLIYRNRLATIQSKLGQMWFRISTKMCSNSIKNDCG